MNASSPAVLPPFVRQSSLVLEPAGRACPGSARRKAEFAAGRRCATTALRALGLDTLPEPLPRAPSGAPLWPAGATGSITHAHGYVWAAVARTSDAVAVGIDTERIVDDGTVRRVATVVAAPEELATALRAGLGAREALTLVFSAKEAIFKCLHAQVGRMFDFVDVRITGVEASGAFGATVMRALSPAFPEGAALEGRFAIDAPWIHTGMALVRARE